MEIFCLAVHDRMWYAYMCLPYIHITESTWKNLRTQQDMVIGDSKKNCHGSLDLKLFVKNDEENGCGFKDQREET